MHLINEFRINNIKAIFDKEYLFSCQIWFGTFKENIFQAKKNVCVGGFFGPEICFFLNVLHQICRGISFPYELRSISTFKTGFMCVECNFYMCIVEVLWK